MELLGLLAMLVVTGLLIVPAVLAILALVRLQELRARLERSQAEPLEQRLDTLERRLQRLEQSFGTLRVPRRCRRGSSRRSPRRRGWSRAAHPVPWSGVADR